MASVYSTQWVSNSPRLRLDYTVSYPDGDTGRITWTLYYVATSAASTSSSRSWAVAIGGTTVKTGTYDIDGVTGTKQIATGYVDFDRTTASRSISCYAWLNVKLTWSGSYKATITTATGTATLSAKTSYTITFDDNGGSDGPGTATKWYNTALTIPSTVPTRSGYIFVGWGTSASATSKSYSAGDTYPASSNAAVTLYAVWKKTITITFNDNEGSGGPGTQSADIYNATTSYQFALPTTVPERALHNFLGWSTSATATSASYQPGGTLTASADVTLYAVWELAYIRPSIAQLTAYRCGSDGQFNDDGVYGCVIFTWAVDTTVVSSRVCKKILIRVKGQQESSWREVSVTDGVGETSGVVVQLITGIAADYKYDIEVIVYDDYGSNEPMPTYISSSKMVIDIPNDDSGIGILMPATAGTTEEPVMEIGGKGYFYKGMYLIDADSGDIVDMTLTSDEYDQIMENLGG